MTTIVIPISRRDYLRPVFNCLNELDRPEDTELLILVDGDNDLARAIDRRLDSINYRRIQIVKFGEQPAEDLNDRRYRIAAIHNKAKYLISEESDFVFLIEDDTVYPPDTLIKLLQLTEIYAYAEGVQMGRRKTPYIGAWHCSDKRIESLRPGEDIEEIDAGGLYCCVTYADLYRLHQFEPYDKKGKNGLSCDINYGLWLKEMGMKSCIDWSIVCDHIGERGSVNLGNTTPVKVVFEKRGDEWTGRTEV